MNITDSLTRPIHASTATAKAAEVQQASSSGVEPASSEKRSEATPLFVGGLANWNAMMTPETLGALFALNGQGEVQYQSNGAPILKAGESIDTPAERLLSQHLTLQHNQKAGVDTGYAPQVSDAQKQFFHQVTGYNLVVDGPLYGVYDDAGNLVPDASGKDGRSSPVWQLVSDITGNGLEEESDRQEIDADWFAKWQDKMSAAGSSLPPEWAAKASAYFDQALDALFEKDDGKKGRADVAKIGDRILADDQVGGSAAALPPSA